MTYCFSSNSEAAAIQMTVFYGSSFQEEHHKFIARQTALIVH